jgi:fatty acyl-CoA reductase
MWVLVSHLIPAYAADAGYFLLGKRPRMVRIYKKIHKEIEVLKFFTMRDWQWTHSNIEMLRSHMSQEDQKVGNLNLPRYRLTNASPGFLL